LKFFRVKTGKRVSKIILDGAHNPAATRVLVHTLLADRINKVKILFGALKDKDIRQMVNTLSPHVVKGVVVAVPSSRTAPASKY